MKTKIKIESIFGKLLFEHEAEDNTVKGTLLEAVKSGANLYGADLRGANLGEWGKLSKNSDILVVGPIGSRDGYTNIYKTDKGVFVSCGCFRGTLEEFAEKVEETHGDNRHARDYKALIEFVKKRYEAEASGECVERLPHLNGT